LRNCKNRKVFSHLWSNLPVFIQSKNRVKLTIFEMELSRFMRFLAWNFD